MFRVGSVATWAALSALSLTAICRADPIDSPRYQAWAKFGVESTNTLAGTINVGGMSMPMELSRKLVELTPDHAKVETTVTMTIMGQVRPGKPSSEIIPAKEEPKDVKATGEDTVEAMGKTFKCKTYEITSAPQAGGPPGGGPPGGPSDSQGKGKIWVAPEVPGGVVKMEVTGRSRGSGGQEGAEVTITYLLKAYEAK